MTTTRGIIPCSVGILTFNSAATLRRALDSVAALADVVICDGGSTDDTLSIAREYGCTIIAQDPTYKYPNNRIKDFSKVRNQCLAAASHDWFLYIDSDEEASPELIEDIRRTVMLDREPYIYKIPICNFVEGRRIKYSSNYPGYQHRFFCRRSGARFIKNVHERIDFDKNAHVPVPLTSPWYVYLTQDEVDHYVKNTIEYIYREVERSKNITFGGYLYWVLGVNSLTMAKTAIRSGRNYLLHGFRDTMPIRMELGRIAYVLVMIYFITKYQLTRVWKYLFSSVT
jgi:glycosyltransferase involved in cell wall biosynthesis